MDTFTGVITTGIYCRPGCPAQPLRRNMLPFGHPAAALVAAAEVFDQLCVKLGRRQHAIELRQRVVDRVGQGDGGDG